MDNKIKKLLYRSFDEDLNPEEKKILKKALAKSEELRDEQAALSEIRKNLSSAGEFKFGPQFTDNVMRKIFALEDDSEPELYFENLFRIFRPVAVAALLLIIFISSYNLIVTDEYSFSGILNIPEASLEEAFEPDYSLYTE